MVTKLEDYVALDGNDYDADFRYKYRDKMIDQIEQIFYNEKFSHQGQDKHDDSLQERIIFGLIKLSKWEDRYQIMVAIKFITNLG